MILTRMPGVFPRDVTLLSVETLCFTNQFWRQIHEQPTGSFFLLSCSSYPKFHPSYGIDEIGIEFGALKGLEISVGLVLSNSPP